MWTHQEIIKLEEGLYSGKTTDGEKVQLFRGKKGQGYEIQILNSKGWWECKEYDENGFCDGERFEKDPT